MKIQCKTYKVKNPTDKAYSVDKEPIVYMLNIMIGALSGNIDELEVMDDYEKYQDIELVEVGKGVLVDDMANQNNPIIHALDKWKEKLQH
jgi:hypothetical protein